MANRVSHGPRTTKTREKSVHQINSWKKCYTQPTVIPTSTIPTTEPGRVEPARSPPPTSPESACHGSEVRTMQELHGRIYRLVFSSLLSPENALVAGHFRFQLARQPDTNVTILISTFLLQKYKFPYERQRGVRAPDTTTPATEFPFSWSYVVRSRSESKNHPRGNNTSHHPPKRWHPPHWSRLAP